MAKYQPFVAKSITQLAAELATSEPTIRIYLARGMPGERGNYVIRECIAWIRENVAPRKNLVNKDPALAEDQDSKDLKRALDKQKYRDNEVKFAERVKELMPREHVREVFVRTSELYRTAGELLRKHHGDEAQRILLDAIGGAEKELENMFHKLEDA